MDVKQQPYLSMDKFQALLSSGSANLGMAMSFVRSVNCKVTSSEALRTKVRDADTSGKVKHRSTVSKRDIRTLAFGHDAFNLTSKTCCDVLLAKIDERSIALARYGALLAARLLVSSLARFVVFYDVP